MGQPNPNFDQLAAITIENYSKELADNVSANIPLLKLLDSMGNLKADELDGGTKILENLRYGSNASFN